MGASSDIVRKKNFVKYKLQYLNQFIKLKNLYLKKVWGIIVNEYTIRYLKFLKKYDLLYSLNQYKFNKLVFLPILSNILTKILGKKIEYNIINLKSIAYNTDLFTNALAFKLKKRRINYIKNMFSILNRAYLPSTNTIKERSILKGKDKLDLYQDQYKDLKIISNMGASSNNNLSSLLYEAAENSINKIEAGQVESAGVASTQVTGRNTSFDNIHNLIYKKVGYKNMAGIRLEVKGRLTKRYRADRSIYSLKWKGGLKNIDSSFRGLSSVLFRGNSKSNVSYSIAQSKRRIGAFAVKGWIGGK